jgi:sugar lactone lactonase YvrE
MRRKKRVSRFAGFAGILAITTAFPAAGFAHEGWGIVVDASGRIYVGDIPANTIWRISRDGKVERIARKHSHALHMDAAGNLYGSDPHLTEPIGSVWRLTASGALEDVVPPNPLALGLQSFAIDPRGNIYSVNARTVQSPRLELLKRNVDGTITPFAGSTPGFANGRGSEARFAGIDGIAWGPDGAMYVADGAYVRRVTLDGVVTTLTARPLTTREWDEDLLGIAVDSLGNVYAADHSGRRILKVTRTGDVFTALSTGSIWTPTGVAVTSAGLFVLEHLRLPLALLGDLGVGPYLRVRHVATDGTVKELARVWGRNSLLAFGLVVTLAAAIILFAARRRRRRVTQ